jgi:RNA recognition motif-containing protein
MYQVTECLIFSGDRTGESRGFAFVRYKYADEAQKAVEHLDGSSSLNYSRLFLTQLFFFLFTLKCSCFFPRSLHIMMG